MQVFLSWSGEKSRKLAEAIRDWLPAVLQSCEPYFTPSDIEKGTRWSQDIAKELESCQVGILCITRENIHSDWILFEAGALSKSMDKSHVCPILFGIKNSDLSGPLQQFQTTEFEKPDFRKLLNIINNKLGDRKLISKLLDSVLDKWWPDLETKVAEIMESDSDKKDVNPIRQDREILEEILQLLRQNKFQEVYPKIKIDAIQALLKHHIDLHNDNANHEGGYQDSLDILKAMSRPLNYVASRFVKQSDAFDNLFAEFVGLEYKIVEEIEISDSSDTPF